MVLQLVGEFGTQSDSTHQGFKGSGAGSDWSELDPWTTTKTANLRPLKPLFGLESGPTLTQIPRWIWRSCVQFAMFVQNIFGHYKSSLYISQDWVCTFLCFIHTFSQNCTFTYFTIIIKPKAMEYRKGKERKRYFIWRLKSLNSKLTFHSK